MIKKYSLKVIQSNWSLIAPVSSANLLSLKNMFSFSLQQYLSCLYITSCSVTTARSWRVFVPTKMLHLGRIGRGRKQRNDMVCACVCFGACCWLLEEGECVSRFRNTAWQHDCGASSPRILTPALLVPFLLVSSNFVL